MTLALVTGGAGFIGSNMVRFLLDKGVEVRVLDNFETGKRENLADIKQKVNVVEGDIRDKGTVSKAFDGVSMVFHLAALGSVPRSMKDPQTTHQVNVDGTFNVMEAARAAKVQRVVFASSSSVYGECPVLPQHEGLPLAPISPYGATKAIAEIYLRSYFNTFGLQSACLRYYNVFGPRQDPTSQYAAAIPLFVSLLMKDQQPGIFGDGEQSRGFTYIENVMQANWKAATAARELKGEAMNISVEKSVTVNRVVDTIKELLGKQHIASKYLPPREGDIKYSLADISRARELIGYDPQVDFVGGIRKAIDWYKANLK